jgi:4-amino-4-deoxy-L-arabinose transferase-like glycosyltransferase
MRRIFLLLFLITDLALILRLYAVSRLGESDIVTYSESGITANNLVNGKEYTFDFFGQRPDHPLQAFMPPMYPGLIAFCLRFFANPALGLEFIQALFSTLTVVAIFFVAREFSSQPGTALLTALGVATYPVFVIMCAIPIQTTLNTFLLLVLMLASMMLLKNLSLKWAGISGILIGINILTRPALAGFVPLLLFWLWLNTRRDILRLFKVAATIVLLMTVTLLPWVLRNYQVLGSLGVISTNGGFAFWQGNNPFTTGSAFDVYSERVDQFLGLPHDANSAEIVNVSPYPMPREITKVSAIEETDLERMLYRAGFDFIRNNPARWFELAITKLEAFWWFRTNIGESYEASWTGYYKILYSVLLVLFIPGLLLSLRNWRRYLLLYLLIFYYTFAYMIYNVLTRYRWEIEVFLLIFAALSITSLFHKASAERSLKEKLL